MGVHYFPIGIVAVYIAFCIATSQATTCYSCTGQACLRTSQVSVAKQCRVANERCISMFSGYVAIKKACYSDLTNDERLVCDTASNPSCYACSGDHCNRLARVDHKCKTCIATSSNSTCLNSPATVADTRCPAARTQDVYCSVSIAGNVTHRGCITSNREMLACLQNPSTCSMCAIDSTGACNRQNFPANRRQCHYCTGARCASTSTSNTTAVPRFCPQIDDRCVTLNHDGVFRRLCAGEMTTAEREYCGAYNTSCVYCSGNGCNVAVPPAPPTTPGGTGATLHAGVAQLMGALVVVLVAGRGRCT